MIRGSLLVDGGCLDNRARLHWQGRLNDSIKIGGANVLPREIDKVIRNHRGVKLAQTVGVPDDLFVELVVACIVPHQSATLSKDRIKAFAREKLASYKGPRRGLFSARAELEITGDAKINTAELRKLASGCLAAAATGA